MNTKNKIGLYISTALVLPVISLAASAQYQTYDEKLNEIAINNQQYAGHYRDRNGKFVLNIIKSELSQKGKSVIGEQKKLLSELSSKLNISFTELDENQELSSKRQQDNKTRQSETYRINYVSYSFSQLFDWFYQVLN